MTIDKAIELLQAEKAAGGKNIIAAWWLADQFQRADDEEWAADVEQIDDKFDWSSTHDDILYCLESLLTDNENED
jgi:hypothetical protein